MTDTERGQVRRIGAVLCAAVLLSVGAVTPTAFAEGDEGAGDTAPTTTVEVVAVGLPPVPPTTTIVAVGKPPVPPTTQAVVESKVAVQPATAANRPVPQVAPPEVRVSHAAQSVAARLGLLLDLLP